MKINIIIAISMINILAGCSENKRPDEVVRVYYSSTISGDFDTFLSCLSPATRQECLAKFGDGEKAQESFSKLPENVRKLSKTVRITKVKTHGPEAMVWVAEGEDMPEQGKVYSLTKQGDTWLITGQQMLVSFYKNGSKLDWEIPTERVGGSDG